jgi:hypothetical protein
MGSQRVKGNIFVWRLHLVPWKLSFESRNSEIWDLTWFNQQNARGCQESGRHGVRSGECSTTRPEGTVWVQKIICASRAFDPLSLHRSYSRIVISLLQLRTMRHWYALMTTVDGLALFRKHRWFGATISELCSLNMLVLTILRGWKMLEAVSGSNVPSGFWTPPEQIDLIMGFLRPIFNMSISWSAKLTLPIATTRWGPRANVQNRKKNRYDWITPK